MSDIVELAPLLAATELDATTDYLVVQGIWNAHAQTAAAAHERGHGYHRLGDGALSADAVVSALAGADALVLAPTAAATTGMHQPVDGAASGRLVGHRLLDLISAEFPSLHVVLVSHFLVGHGVTHHNAKPQTWGLRAVEAHLRGGRNPWTILRPTWLSTIHDESYQTRLTQDQHADGLVSTASIAAAVVTAVEHPRASKGRTAAIYNLSVPERGHTDLVAQFSALEPDYEAQFSARPARV